jgi:hypothetical protein
MWYSPMRVYDETMVPVAITVPLPKRSSHVLVYKTNTLVSSDIHIKRSEKIGLTLTSGDKREKRLETLLLDIITRILPEPLDLEIEYSIKGKCAYPPGITASLTNTLATSLTAFYNEHFTEKEFKGILSNMLSWLEIPNILIEPLAISVAENSSIIYSSTGDYAVIQDKLDDCDILGEERMSEPIAIDEKIIDLDAKIVAIALSGLVQTKNSSKKEFYKRALNSLWFQLYGYKVSEELLLTPSLKGKVVYIKNL